MLGPCATIAATVRELVTDKRTRIALERSHLTPRAYLLALWVVALDDMGDKATLPAYFASGRAARNAAVIESPLVSAQLAALRSR